MEMYLKQDVVSNFNEHVYGRKGNKVTVLVHHGNVVIAEDANGKRFPVKVEHLLSEPIIEEEKQEEAPVKIAPAPSQSKPALKNKAVIISKNQTQLF